jgi:crotonobetainyl-CoA:carnitine CoA-transferase CaiB-like acyl-CoA transferase
MSDGVLFTCWPAPSPVLAGDRRGAGSDDAQRPRAALQRLRVRDGKWLSWQPEPHFCQPLQVASREDLLPHQNNRDVQPETFAFFRQTFKTKTRDEWFAIMQQTTSASPRLQSRRGPWPTPESGPPQVTRSTTRSSGRSGRLASAPSCRTRSGAARPTRRARSAHGRGPRVNGYSGDTIAAMRESGAVG